MAKSVTYELYGPPLLPHHHRLVLNSLYKLIGAGEYTIQCINGHWLRHKIVEGTGIYFKKCHETKIYNYIVRTQKRGTNVQFYTLLVTH